jgi:hypothetical protein
VQGNGCCVEFVISGGVVVAEVKRGGHWALLVEAHPAVQGNGCCVEFVISGEVVVAEVKRGGRWALLVEAHPAVHARNPWPNRGALWSCCGSWTKPVSATSRSR